MILDQQADAGDLVGALHTARMISTERHRFAENHRVLAFESIVSAEAKSGASVIFEQLRMDERDPIIRTRLLIGRAGGLLLRMDSHTDN